jgi:hypothetical protein
VPKYGVINQEKKEDSRRFDIPINFKEKEDQREMKWYETLLIN